MKLHVIFNSWKWSKEVLGGGNKGAERGNKALEKSGAFSGYVWKFTLTGI